MSASALARLPPLPARGADAGFVRFPIATGQRFSFVVREELPAGIDIDERRIVEARPSVEERLRAARECHRLLADLFNLQAEASRSMPEIRLSGDALGALRQLCVSAANDLEQLARELPPAVANWRREPGPGT